MLDPRYVYVFTTSLLALLGGCYAGLPTDAEGDADGQASTGTVPGAMEGDEAGESGTVDNPPPRPPDLPSSTEDVGRIALHRLTRTEYQHTLEDLFGTSFDEASFIRGGTGVGFDNEAALLRDISASLAEGYIEHARVVAADVVADPAVRDRIMSCAGTEDDQACAEAFIGSFGLRAWRRPLFDEEQTRLAGRYRDAREMGASHDEAMEMLVRMFVGSPNFVFHVELDADPDDSRPHRLDAHALASRLSYALWTSMPDDELFAVAADESLLTDEVLQAQVERMLDDPRAERFQRAFLESWVRLPLLDAQSTLIDTDVYPDWSQELGDDMRAEIRAYLAEFVEADLPWSSFLTADLNFVSPRLAQHYGIELPDDSGEFVRVEDHPDERIGYLGLAGFLTYTSRADRTAPTFRGKIILESLQCLTLVVPPDVPELPEEEDGAVEFPTIRERLEEHRKSPDCAGCHNLLDPLGLGLENFDATGAWRDVYADGHRINARVDYNGESIEGLIALATQVAAEPRFLNCPAEKMFTYALRRTPSGDDRSRIRALATTWNAGSVRDLVVQLVLSDAFRFRQGETVEEGE